MIKKRLFIAIGLSALLFHIGCHTEAESEHGEHHGEGIKLLATSPLKKDTVTTKDYVCQIHSSQHIELRALEKGYLEKIYVDEGQTVKKGQLMFQIMPQLYQAELQKAEAEANFAKIEFLNTKALADSNVVSQNELALAKATYDKAKAELALAAVHLGFTTVKAPFNGIMDRFNVRLGSLVEEGELLTSLSDNSSMWAYFNVPEAEYLDYMETVKKDSVLAVHLMMANKKFFQEPGIVETIEADFNSATGNIAFRATFPNPKGLLRHGETGSIIVEVPVRGAVLIPQKATFEVLDKNYVFVIGEDSVIRSKKIKIGAELSHIYAVTEGLKPTDKILLEGLRHVKEGDKIAYEFVDPAKAVSNLNLYAE